jgi:quercetin dioxygenase-like cupin family protein
MSDAPVRFVTAENLIVEESPWTLNHWLCRPDIVAAEKLMLVRAEMAPGKCHPFHRHPALEEIIYVVSGRAEQWVDREMKLLGPGDSAHVPVNVVHGTYNAGAEPLTFLAILSPAKFDGPAMIDVSEEEPWKSLRPVKR